MQRNIPKFANLVGEPGLTPSLPIKWRSRYQIIDHENHSPRIVSSDNAAALKETGQMEREQTTAGQEREVLEIHFQHQLTTKRMKFAFIEAH